jgi:CheY-like chemotaxis protein
MQPQPVQPKRVLLVDDDAWLRPMLAELLEDEGYEVFEADSGSQALHQIREHRPDVVVLDVVLPWRSGLAVLDEVRADERTRRLPIILMSGQVDIVETGQAHRAVAALHKPLDLGALLSKVAVSAAQPSADAEIPRPDVARRREAPGERLRGGFFGPGGHA